MGIGLLTGLFRLIRIFGILRFLKIGLSLGAIIAGVVLFILGKRDPSASKVKRLIIPIVCVVLGVILFIIPFGGFASAGGYSTPDNIIAGTSDSYSTTVYFSPEEDDYYVNFYPSYDGVLYVYTKDTDGCYYYPEISVLNERLSGVEYSYNGSFYSVPIEAGKTYYVCTRFYDYSYAESNYYSYGSAYYDIYLEFEKDFNGYISTEEAGGLEYNLNGSLEYWNNADLRYLDCAPGETVVTLFTSSESL